MFWSSSKLELELGVEHLHGNPKFMYSQTSLVSTPGDPPNCCSLSVVLANHID